MVEHDADEESRVQPGDVVGRYRVLDEIGRGGMGRVLRAHDPSLDRDVAIKVVGGARLTSTHRQRLVVEARSMAKLSHPYVVEVYDVVEVGADQIAIVMEYVRGETLRAYLGRHPPWETVIARFREAGLGLHAAHEAGILHRDFKPDNVLVGNDGRARVTDFGLAGDLPPDSLDDDSRLDTESAEHVGGSEGLTEPGSVVGTLAYLAPERLAGEPADASTDQFALCVSLWEGLFGERPFAGSSGIEMAIAMAGGPPSPPNTSVPTSIVSAVHRGLSSDPDERWPDVAALVEALRAGVAESRPAWRIVVGSIGGVVVVAGGLALGGEAQADPCSDAVATDHLRGTWDAAVRARVRHAILGTDAVFASDVWSRTEAALDDFAARWVAMHVATCRATMVRREQSPALMDLRMACLSRAVVEVGAVTAELAEADTSTVEHAHALVDGVGDLRPCAHVETLQADIEPPAADERAAVKSIEAHVAASRAADAAGRYDRALQAAQQAATELEEVDYGPVHTEVAVARGIALGRVGDHEGALEQLEEAARLAITWRQEILRLQAVLALVRTTAVGLHRPEAARRWISAAQELAGDDPRAQARVARAVVAARDAEGKLGEAETEARRAVELAESVLPREHVEVLAARVALASSVQNQGKLAEAESETRAAIEALERSLGLGHPEVAGLRHNLALALHQQDRLDEAQEEYRRAVTLAEAAFGAGDRRLAQVRSDFAALLMDAGDPAASEAEHRRALAELDADLEADDLERARVRCDLAIAIVVQGRLPEAEAELRAGLRLMEQVLGADHVEVARVRHNLANVLEETGDDEGALGEHRRVVASLERGLDDGHPDLARARTSLAYLLVELGRPEEARPIAEAAWVVRGTEQTPPPRRGITAFVLAQALDESDPARALGLAERAREDFQASGEQWAEDLAMVTTWLDAR